MRSRRFAGTTRCGAGGRGNASSSSPLSKLKPKASKARREKRDLRAKDDSKRMAQISRAALKVIAGFLFSRRIRGARVLKRELTSLGPTFVKLGQAIATRPDVFGDVVTTELATLHDQCTTFSSEEAYEVLRDELGDEKLCLFRGATGQKGSKFWEEEPIAAASLGQVYKARLKIENSKDDVVDVAVKVQRPGARGQILLDVKTLKRTIGQSSYFEEIVNLVGDTLLEEVDYLKEASNAKEFATIQRDCKFVVVPRVYDSVTTSRVLVLEWIEGQSPKEIANDKEKLLDLTNRAIQCTIAQLLCSNVLHGDPHGGNLLYTADRKLAYLDFGVLCRVKPEQAQALLNSSVHIVNKQYRDFVYDLVDMEVLDDQKVSVEEVVEAFDKEYSQNANLSDQMRLNNTMMKLGYVYKFNAPPYYTTLIRALAPLEGYGLSADPKFNILSACYPLIIKKMLNPQPTSDTRGPVRTFLSLVRNAIFLLSTVIRGILWGAIVELVRAAKKLMGMGPIGKVDADEKGCCEDEDGDGDGQEAPA